jgi:hypothetical protein
VHRFEHIGDQRFELTIRQFHRLTDLFEDLIIFGIINPENTSHSHDSDHFHCDRDDSLHYYTKIFWLALAHVQGWCNVRPAEMGFGAAKPPREVFLDGFGGEAAKTIQKGTQPSSRAYGERLLW